MATGLRQGPRATSRQDDVAYPALSHPRDRGAALVETTDWATVMIVLAVATGVSAAGASADASRLRTCDPVVLKLDGALV